MKTHVVMRCHPKNNNIITSGVTKGLSQVGNLAEGGPLANTQKKIEKY